MKRHNLMYNILDEKERNVDTSLESNDESSELKFYRNFSRHSFDSPPFLIY